MLSRVRAALAESPALAGRVVEYEDGGRRTPAAVLFPLVQRDELTVLLTQRTAHLKAHPGQISFPGGRIEPDDESPLAAALRETEEEIGLSRQHVAVLGYLPNYFTGTGFEVTPVVGLIQPPFELKKDAFEVAEIFEVPLAHFLAPANYHRMAVHYEGRRRSFYNIPYQHRFVWGATAGMIRTLFERLPVVCCEADYPALAGH